MVTSEYIAVGGNRHPASADWNHDSLCFGAGNNVAIWRGQSIEALLKGHTDIVTCVRVGHDIVSGSADKTVRIWRDRRLWRTLPHGGSINTISLHDDLIIVGAADATIKIWQGRTIKQTITLEPRFLPLTTAITTLDTTLVLAVAGTATFIQIFTSDGGNFDLQAQLTGHEGWIRSLDFSDVNILASASQDKFIRLWRFTKESSGISTKAHRLGDWLVQYDALLVGHEDWIYTVRWKGDRLLSASADNSLAIWRYSSDLWVCDVRLGEISSLKGATTATGSTGGFFIGLWAWADGVVSLGRTGSWRRWNGDWEPQVGISGHTREVQSVAWSTDGSYLLSVSLDQTTRLWACKDGWHEFARPQIHGYDLQCIATLPGQFVSGAEEKLLRVFNQPVEDVVSDNTVNTTNVPVLGLSNKAGERLDTMATGHAPYEDQLARFTLWPEHEKLYGHGNEISAIASANNGSLIATSCKASSIDHAVIRLYDTRTWREAQVLKLHSLTVTAMAFSPDDRHLLTVGRDRQWAVFDSVSGSLVASYTGHSRMILGCAWGSDDVFATAARDRTLKLWHMTELLATFTSAAAVTAVAIHDHRIAFGDETGRVTVVRCDETWQNYSQVITNDDICPAKAVTALAWRTGTSGALLAVASEDHALRLWKL